MSCWDRGLSDHRRRRFLPPFLPRAGRNWRPQSDVEMPVPFRGGFTFPNFLADVFSVFLFVLWFWLLITIARDLFRRDDVSGFSKVLWVILLIVLPFIGIFAYMLTQARGMGEREEAHVQQTRENLRQIVGFSVADELEKLGRLKHAGSISEQEYASLRTKLLQ